MINQLTNYTSPDYYFFSLDSMLYIGVFIMILLMGINIYLYRKMRIPILIIVIFLFSELIGIMLLTDPQFFVVNYLVYFVLFFMIFQASLLLKLSIEMYERGKNK